MGVHSNGSRMRTNVDSGPQGVRCHGVGFLGWGREALGYCGLEATSSTGRTTFGPVSLAVNPSLAPCLRLPTHQLAVTSPAMPVPLGGPPTGRRDLSSAPGAHRARTGRSPQSSLHLQDYSTQPEPEANKLELLSTDSDAMDSEQTLRLAGQLDHSNASVDIMMQPTRATEDSESDPAASEPASPASWWP